MGLPKSVLQVLCFCQNHHPSEDGVLGAASLPVPPSLVCTCCSRCAHLCACVCSVCIHTGMCAHTGRWVSVPCDRTHMCCPCGLPLSSPGVP